MDIGSIIGLAAGVAFTIISILLTGSPIGNYMDAASAMIVFGGAFSATLFATPLDKFVTALKSIKFVFKSDTLDTSAVINKIIELANVARKEGLLALEEAAQSMDDKFLQKGILLIVDGTDPELVRNILETELGFIEERHGQSQGVFTTLAAEGPAWGMIGTLIGLINMLNDMSNVASLGPNMAVALITTFYGSLTANLFANPVGWKLKSISADEVLMKEVMIEGMLSIQAGENPRIIEEKLKAFLSPALRKNMGEGAEGEDKEAGGEK